MTLPKFRLPHDKSVASMRRLGVSTGFLGLLLLLAGGCSDSDSSGTDSETTSTDTQPAAKPSGTTPTDQGFIPNDNLVATAPSGEPVVGQVPLNVWYQQPVAVARGQVPVPGVTDIGTTDPATSVAMNVPDAGNPALSGTGPGMTGGGTTTTPTETAVGTPTDEPMGSGGTRDLKVIPAVVITDEVKNSVNEIKQALGSVRAYNDAYLKIQSDSAVIAALASIGPQHPEDIRWKENAKYLRDFSVVVGEKAQTKGGGAKREVEAEFANLEEIMAGSVPATADPNTEESRAYSEVAGRGYLMERIERGQKWLSSNIIAKEKFEEEQEQVRHEAGILTAMFNVLGHESYDSADEEDYQKYIDQAINHSRSMLEAADERDFEKFQQGLSGLEKSCNECHQDYYFAG